MSSDTPNPTQTPETVETPETPLEPEPSFGWNRYAEKINGRFAMVGFVILLLVEFLTHQDLFTWLGLR
ncbi:MAG: chlorophyll a/b-binding protein [Microcoleaceae cyanobacterium]